MQYAVPGLFDMLATQYEPLQATLIDFVVGTTDRIEPRFSR